MCEGIVGLIQLRVNCKMGNYESFCRTDFGFFQSSGSVSGVVDADKQAMPLQTAGTSCGTFWMIPKD